MERTDLFWVFGGITSPKEKVAFLRKLIDEKVDVPQDFALWATDILSHQKDSESYGYAAEFAVRGGDPQRAIGLYERVSELCAGHLDETQALLKAERIAKETNNLESLARLGEDYVDALVRRGTPVDVAITQAKDRNLVRKALCLYVDEAIKEESKTKVAEIFQKAAEYAEEKGFTTPAQNFYLRASANLEMFAGEDLEQGRDLFWTHDRYRRAMKLARKAGREDDVKRIADKVNMAIILGKFEDRSHSSQIVDQHVRDLKEMGLIDEAVSYYRGMVSMERMGPAYAADELTSLGRPAEALPFYRRAIEEYRGKGNYKLAISLAQKAGLTKEAEEMGKLSAVFTKSD